MGSGATELFVANTYTQAFMYIHSFSHTHALTYTLSYLERERN
jgi:hypothetical protein